MGVSDIVFLETLIKGTVQLKKQFKECCLSEVPEGVEVFATKAKSMTGKSSFSRK